NLISAEADFRDRAHVGGLQWVSTKSPQMVNEFRFSYPYRNEKHIAGALTGAQPAVTISGIANFGGSVSVGDVFAEKIPSWNDNLTYTRGPHTFKGGFGYSRIIDVQQGDSFTQYVFGSVAAYQAAVSGANPKSYDTVNALIGNTRVGYISNFFNFFGQDSWQVRPSLLVTYGIRYDRFLSPSSPGAPSFPQPLTTATAPAIPSVFTVTPNFKNAYAMTATLQVSRELSKNDALTFAYVNTGGRQLQWLHNLNLINPLGSLLD